MLHDVVFLEGGIAGLILDNDKLCSEDSWKDSVPTLKLDIL